MSKPTPYYVEQGMADYLLEKWAPVLDYSSKSVKPLESDNQRINTAILLENQEAYCQGRNPRLFREQYIGGNVAGNTYGGQGPGVVGSFPRAPGQTGGNPNSIPALGDANYAQGDARLPKVLIPMIRRTFPELVTNEIVGVQPMSGPVGLAFALRYKYSGTNLNDGPQGSDSFRNGGTTSPWVSGSRGRELGYNYLNTAYTGASAEQLSGHADFEIVDEDRGVAALLSQFELNGNIPEIEIQIEKTAVEAGTRRLGAKWSIELEQDLRNMQGIDIDAELTTAMSYEIQAEIDREMVMRMAQSALNGGAYSYWTPVSADGRWLGERTRDFYSKLIIEANKVAVRNRRGAANFVIATPRVCAMLEMLPEFEPMSVNGNVNTAGIGIAKIGTVGGRFTVYRDTRTEAQNINNGYGPHDNPNNPFTNPRRAEPLEYALLGYKGAEYFDTGLIYCPYIPVMIQRAFGPNDFSPRVGLLTRYGVVDNLFGSELYYHIIIVKGLGEGFVPGTASNYL